MKLRSLFEAQESTYVMHYKYEFAVGGGRHHIDVYEKYTDHRGLEDQVFHSEGRKGDVIKEIKNFAKSKGVKLPKEQLERVQRIMSERQDGIVTHDDKFYRY
jgi:hypothetical protein